MAVKKKWYDIIAPEQFGAAVIGETPAADPKHLVGRTIPVSLTELARDSSKFYIKLLLRVDRIEGSKAFTTLVGHDTMRERVYRIVQRYARRVDVVQDVTTKDGRKIRLKTIFILVRRVGTSIKDVARKEAKELVASAAAEMTFDELIAAILAGDLQKEIRKRCAKVYPVGNVEIRKSEVLA